MQDGESMDKKSAIRDTVYRYISAAMNCSPDDLCADGIRFIRDESRPDPYVKILSIQDADIVTVSKGLFDEVSTKLKGKSRDELYESSYVFGQTIHYIPDLNMMTPLPYPEEYTFELLTGREVYRLNGLKGFEHALAFDENGFTPTCIVLYAKDKDSVIALAGASAENDELREVGIDVKKEHRGKKLASILVRNLSAEILRQGKVPFYSASATNLASQAAAVRSGYMPLWTDSYGVRGYE